MLVYEFKLKGKPEQFRLINEAIRTMQFVRNKAVRFWMDNAGAGKKELSRLSSTLATEFPFAKRLGSQARQAACERAWFAISRFYANGKSKKAGKKGYPRFQRYCRSIEYKQAGWKLVDGCGRLTLSDGHGIGTLKLVGNQPLNDVLTLTKNRRISLLISAVADRKARRNDAEKRLSRSRGRRKWRAGGVLLLAG